MALEQGYEVTARCHDSACDWYANPLPAPWFVWCRDPVYRLREAIQSSKQGTPAEGRAAAHRAAYGWVTEQM
jgi:hypothetical protein